MELSIPAYSIKEFTAVLKSFKSFSDFLHIHPHHSRLKLSAVSATRSTYAITLFESTYFDHYLLSNSHLGLIEVAIKPLFKILSHQNHLSSIESCNILIDSKDSIHDPNSTQIHHLKHRLTLKLKLTVGIIRSFSLPYANSRTLNPTDLRSDNSPNHWICLSSNLKQWIDHFVINPTITQNLIGSVDIIEEICFCYLNDGRVLLKTVNLADEFDPNVLLPKKSDIFNKGTRQLSTSLTISSSEFEEFHINLDQGPITTTLSVKDVRSILELGVVLGSPVDVGFSVGGRPVYFSITNEQGNLAMEFVLASTSGEELGSIQNPHTQNLLQHQNITKEKQKQKQKEKSLAGSQISSRLESLAPSRNLQAQDISQNRSSSLISSRANQPQQPLFRTDEDEMTPDDDDLDQIPAEQWAQVEKEAIALSQTRKRARLQTSQSNLTTLDQDDQLLPRHAPQPTSKPRWKLFDD
ncbi:hypothetical protein O181_061119 [Austropuccinia psidii MF-1]|uniref:DNA repair protein rad9 n=1 Tax=Austropuccinia psidii MF-1 TaxID=1389203 RepID=A0A9Q3EHP5_9BASI|nr:hypothetical protein [Austropuccinia psidii MF-1]